VHQQSVVVRDLWQVHRSVVARADHPSIAHPDELTELPAVRLVTFVPSMITLTHADGASVALRMRTVFAIDNLYAALTAVREGIGFAILPRFATQRLLDNGELRELCPAWHPPTVSLSLTYPPGRLRSQRVDALIHFLRQELTGEAGLGIAYLAQEGVRETVTIPVLASPEPLPPATVCHRP
jgi:DNA-binding transcriptional LysR family regulator